MNRFVFRLLTFAIIWTLLNGCNPSERFEYVKIEVGKEDIYLKKINWGITGDAQKTAISTSKLREFDDFESDYIDDSGQLEFFYKTSGDTLLIFVRRQLIAPKNWDSKIIIKQVVLDNPSFMNLYDEERSCVESKKCIRSF